MLGRTMHGIVYDAAHDEFAVPQQFAQAIMTFRGGANGEEPPVRIIQGSKTMLRDPDRLDIDTVHNEIYVPMDGAILVFAREANGNVAPIRVLKAPSDVRIGDAVAVDPVHNLLVAQGQVNKQMMFLIFNRTDDGNVAPKAVIKGPKSGITRINQLAVYPPRKLFVAAQPGPIEIMEPENAYVGIWSINDNGDVPPRYVINANAKSGMKKPRGVVLDPKHKELIVADMRLNSVLTYYFPEIF